MSLENFFYKKISMWILLLTIVFSFIFALFFGSLVLKSTTARNIASIPSLLKEIIFEFDHFVIDVNRFDEEKGFKKVSNKSDDLSGYLLLSRFDYKKKRSVVELVEIKTEKVLNTWEPEINKINSYSKLPEEVFFLRRDHSLHRYRMFHPLLLDNGDLIVHSSSPLLKLDICSKVKWIVDDAYHHSNELDAEGNIWVPSWSYPIKTKGVSLDYNNKAINAFEPFFHDDAINKISNDGEVLFSKTIISILQENNLEHLIFPIGENKDPIHLNDIQPTLKDSKFWKKGDVFLSMRNISLVMLYRPSTNKIIWHKQFPWVNQHDVDIINNHQISIFDNNSDDFLKAYVDGSNETLIYDFEKDEVFSPYREAFLKNEIKTKMEGLSEILKNGDIFVEETSWGRIIRMDKKGNIKWQFINREENGKVYKLNWSRFLDEESYNSVVKKINEKKCNEK